MQIQNEKQWLQATKDAYTALTTKHGFDEEVFHTVREGDKIHLDYHGYYPVEWEAEPEGNNAIRLKGRVKHDHIPEGLIVFMMPDSQCSCEACLAEEDKVQPVFQDPIMMLEKIEAWDKVHGKKFK